VHGRLPGLNVHAGSPEGAAVGLQRVGREFSGHALRHHVRAEHAIGFDRFRRGSHGVRIGSRFIPASSASSARPARPRQLPRALVGDLKLQLEAGERRSWLIGRNGVLEKRIAMVEVDLDTGRPSAKRERLDERL
jgi:hypothetical protein